MKRYSLRVTAVLLLLAACSNSPTTETSQMPVIGFSRAMSASRNDMFTCVIGDVTFNKEGRRSYISIDPIEDSKVEVVTNDSASYARISREPRESSSKTRKELLSRFKNLWITTGQPDAVLAALMPKDPQECLYLINADMTGSLRQTGTTFLETSSSRCREATVLTNAGTIVSIHIKDKRGAVCAVLYLDNKLDTSHFPQAYDLSPALVSKAEYDLMVGG